MSENKSLENLDLISEIKFTRQVDGGMEPSLDKIESLSINLEDSTWVSEPSIDHSSFSIDGSEAKPQASGRLSDDETGEIISLLKCVLITEGDTDENSTGGATNLYVDLVYNNGTEFRLFIEGRDGRRSRWEAVAGSTTGLVELFDRLLSASEASG